MDRVMTVPEAADYLRQSVYTVRNWIKQGRLRAAKVGRGYLITEGALRDLLAPPVRQKLGVKESLAMMYALVEEGAAAGLGADSFDKAMAEINRRDATEKEEMRNLFSGSGS